MGQILQKLKEKTHKTTKEKEEAEMDLAKATLWFILSELIIKIHIYY